MLSNFDVFWKQHFDRFWNSFANRRPNRSELFLDVRNNGVREYLRLVILHYLARAIEQEFGKVPRDLLRCLLLGIKQNRVCSEEAVHRVRVLSVHFNLLQNWELDTVFTTSEVFNILRTPWLLWSKLIARERQNLQALTRVLIVNLN